MDRHDGAYNALFGGYLGGALAGPIRVLVEAHLELQASGRIASGIGSPASGRVTVRDPRLARLFGLSVAGAERSGEIRVEEARLPQALRDFLGGDLDSVPWRLSPAGGRVAACATIEGCSVTLMWLARGEERLRYPRSGPELILVLEGELRDGNGPWRRGDIALRASAGAVCRLEAGPVDEGCLMLLVTDAEAVSIGPVARLFSPALARREGAPVCIRHRLA